MKAGDVNNINVKPKRIMLQKRGTVTAVAGDKKITFRYIPASELKSIRCSAYEYLVK